MIVDNNTPGAAHLRIFLDGKLVGGVVRASPDKGWIDAYVVNECAGQRTWTDKVERRHGIVTLHRP